MMSADRSWAAWASFQASSRSRIRLSTDGKSDISMIVGIGGGLYPMMSSNGVFCCEACVLELCANSARGSVSDQSVGFLVQ